MEYKLRNLEKKDLNGMLEWMHDSRINSLYTDKIRNATSADVIKFIEDAQRLIKEGKAYHYAIVNAHDEYLGTISLKNIVPVKGAEYAISMRGAYQGKGIASWATEEILRIAFEELKLHRVYLNVLTENENACRFYSRKCFRYEGESRSCIQVGGEIRSLKWYAMLKEEYEERCDHIKKLN